MSQPADFDLDALSPTELKTLVIQLLGTVAELKQIIVQQREEIGQLRDEIARLKGLPPRPAAAKAKPSGMEQATNPEAAGKKRSRRRRGAKRDKLTVTREVVLKPTVPAGSRFKGYEDILVQDLCIRAEVIRYRRERWLTAQGNPLTSGPSRGQNPSYDATPPNTQKLRQSCGPLPSESAVMLQLGKRGTACPNPIVNLHFDTRRTPTA